MKKMNLKIIRKKRKKKESIAIKKINMNYLNKNGFIIFNEDEMEIADNNKKNIDEIFNDNNKNS
jgi:hypothetical protein